jgi:hypothetical protein
MSTQLTIRPSGFAIEQVQRHGPAIRSKLVRFTSPALTAACTAAGLTHEQAELCGGVLASVIDDLIAISRLARNDFERTKRKERIIAACSEPASYALRIAIAASPINGRAAVAHWDAVCANRYEKHDIGKLAWLLGMCTEAAKKYASRLDRP